MRFILDFVYLIAALLLSPKVIYRAIKQDRYRSGWSQRFGKVTKRKTDTPAIWIHAVSVGEVNAAKTLIADLAAKLPDYEIVISTTTDTGFSRATSLYANDHEVFFYPLDFSFAVNKAFNRIEPAVCLLMELEVWPNFASIAHKRNIPVVVINGRLSDKSFPRYKKIKPAVRWMFGKLALVLAQTEEYAQRFRALGCDDNKVIVTSSLKYDTAQTDDKVEGTDHLAQQLNLTDSKIWVAGSTGTDEEKLILEVFAKLKNAENISDLHLVIVPRKPERFDEIANLIEQSPFTSARFSELKGTDQKLTAAPDIILGDTMGDLRKFYSMATVVFVGRTLVPMGGSDMIEPAALGKCTIFGPHTFNFKQTVDVLTKSNGAIVARDTDHLYEVILQCLTDSVYASEIAANGRKTIIAQQGATSKTVTAVADILNR